MRGFSSIYSFPHLTANWKELAIARSSDGCECDSAFVPPPVEGGWREVCDAESGIGELAREVLVDSRRDLDFEVVVVE